VIFPYFYGNEIHFQCSLSSMECRLRCGAHLKNFRFTMMNLPPTMVECDTFNGKLLKGCTATDQKELAEGKNHNGSYSKGRKRGECR
jgi:hypothetical protein